VPPNCSTVTLKFMPTASAQNRAINVERSPWEMCQNFQKIAQLFLLEICATITVIRNVRNPYSTDCTFCLGFHAIFIAVWNSKICTVQPAFNTVLVASIFVLVCCLGMHALALRNGCCLVAQKCSLSCSLKNESTTQEWVRPYTLIDLMREGEEFSNPMAEIRLDEWLRLNISSLTLTLVIKSPFNLHLTN
jgi:hypothetical protein